MFMSSRADIILIEDEPSLVNLYTFALRDVGDVAVATTKVEANELLKKYLTKRIRPDIILLDLVLPTQIATGLDFSNPAGFEIMEWLRKKDFFKSVPILVLTNLDSDQDRKRSIDLGAKDFLVKANILPKDIVREIKELI